MPSFIGIDLDSQLPVLAVQLRPPGVCAWSAIVQPECVVRLARCRHNRTLNRRCVADHFGCSVFIGLCLASLCGCRTAEQRSWRHRANPTTLCKPHDAPHSHSDALGAHSRFPVNERISMMERSGCRGGQRPSNLSSNILVLVLVPRSA